jgi:hypothetical protein
MGSVALAFPTEGGKMKRRLILAAAALTVIAILVIILLNVTTISGLVRDSQGQPLSGATVRIKATGTSTFTDAGGRFTLTGFAPSFRFRVTAWQDGYYVAGADAWPWASTVEIALSPYAVPDNHDYTWILPAVEARSKVEEWLTLTRLVVASQVPSDELSGLITANLELSCRDCHGQTIYDQWVNGSHALGLRNARFKTMYNGTNLNGEQSPLTTYTTHRDYGRIPLRPDENQPYYGPGFKLDFPDSAGNCATCHLPTLAIENPYGSDPNKAAGVDAQGSHCDFCHKIAAVKLDPTTGQPYENMPGIMSIELMRPSPEKQIFFGPYDDVDVGPDSFLPLMKQSEICAPCHQASFWGVPIYQSFAEWKDSPYPDEGKTCQSCHMKPDGKTTNFAPGRGGLERDPETIPTHDFPGVVDETLLQNTAEMMVTAEREGDRVLAVVKVTNTEGGHHIPTDSPLRQIFLIVTATDAQGQLLSLQNGPVLPDWAGDLAGKPGVYFAKVLEQLWTEVAPTGAYWTQTRLLEDTRLAARATDSSQYVFVAPRDGEVTVEAQLIFRRSYYELMQQKGWDIPDILMERETRVVSPEQ